MCAGPSGAAWKPSSRCWPIGRLDFSSLISDVVPLEQATSAFERMSRGEVSLGMVFAYPEAAPRTMRMTYRPVAAPHGGRVRLGVIGAGNYASSMLLPQLAKDDRVDLVEVATNTGLSGATRGAQVRLLRAPRPMRQRCSRPKTSMLC